MNIEDLKKTHAIHQANVDKWIMYKAAYSGTQALIEWGALKQNQRESKDNYNRRISQTYGFDYSESIVDILNFYLFSKSDNNDYGALDNDPLFELFWHDVDLMGTPFNKWMIRQSRWSSVYGTIGILIDKPQIYGTRTLQQDMQDKIYPFITSYSPLNILDWHIERINGRPTLSYLKLVDDDGIYRIWGLDSWEIWQINNDKPVLLSAGENTLGVIPFIWYESGDTGNRHVGKSDIKEVSLIDISLLRNISQAEEIIDYAAFPMMLKPIQQVGAPKADDLVGVTAVLEFDPRMPESKPEWLSSDVKEPLDAIQTWIDKKIAEIYRSQNVGGIISTAQAKSGESLRREFQMLNARLAAKADSLEYIERSILQYWCLWQGKLDAMNTVTISRPKDFDVLDLAQDLENLLVAKGVVMSQKFNQSIQKTIVRRSLPSMNSKDLMQIDSEIESGRQSVEPIQDNNQDVNSDAAAS